MQLWRCVGSGPPNGAGAIEAVSECELSERPTASEVSLREDGAPGAEGANHADRQLEHLDPWVRARATCNTGRPPRPRRRRTIMPASRSPASLPRAQTNGTNRADHRLRRQWSAREKDIWRCNRRQRAVLPWGRYYSGALERRRRSLGTRDSGRGIGRDGVEHCGRLCAHMVSGHMSGFQIATSIWFAASVVVAVFGNVVF